MARQEGVALSSVGAEGGSRREHSVASPGQEGQVGLGGGLARGMARTEATALCPKTELTACADEGRGGAGHAR